MAGCAGPTRYQPAFGGDQGFADQKLEDNHYRITFAGNAETPRETVENYLLYRAAEITRLTGNDYFIVLEKNTERNVTYRSYPRYPQSAFLFRYGYPYWHPYGLGYWYDPFYDPFYDYEMTTEPIDTYKAYATIAVFPGKKPADDPNAFDARDLIARLGPTVLFPPGVSPAPLPP